MKIRVCTYIAPSLWASALINGDESTFDHPYYSGVYYKEYTRWCKRNKVRSANTVNCGNAYPAMFNGEMTMVCKYTYHVYLKE